MVSCGKHSNQTITKIFTTHQSSSKHSLLDNFTVHTLMFMENCNSILTRTKWMGIEYDETKIHNHLLRNNLGITDLQFKAFANYNLNVYFFANYNHQSIKIYWFRPKTQVRPLNLKLQPPKCSEFCVLAWTCKLRYFDGGNSQNISPNCSFFIEASNFNTFYSYN